MSIMPCHAFASSRVSIKTADLEKSLLSGSDSDPDDEDEDAEEGNCSEIVFSGPIPHMGQVETLIVTALECSSLSWQTLLESLEGLVYLEVDFRLRCKVYM